MNDAVADGTRFYDVVALAVRYYWVGLLCIAAGIAISAWVAFTSEPVYRAEEVVLLSQEGDQPQSSLSDQLGGLASLAGLSLRGADDRKAEALGTLKSRSLAESFVRERNLLPVLFASRWDPAREQWREGAKVPTLWDANKLIADDVLRVFEEKKTGLITVAVEWTDPQLAAQWATDFVDRTNRTLQQAAVERSNRNIEFLKRQLEETEIVGVRLALNNLLESELKTNMLAQRSDDYVFKTIDAAVVPQEKVWPRRALLLAAGFAIGVFAWIVMLVISRITFSVLQQHRRVRAGR